MTARGHYAPTIAAITTGSGLPGAACKGARIPWWDDRVGDELSAERRHRHDMAKAICGGCPVREQCLRDALGDDMASGIWGGELFYRGTLRIKREVA